MSIDKEQTTPLERRARELLADSAERVDARVRSRLSRARYAAVEEAGRTRAGFWQTLAASSRGVAPAGAVAAVLIVALLFWTDRDAPVTESPAAYEDVELLADGEALELIEEWDAGFYEWAASEAEASGARS